MFDGNFNVDNGIETKRQDRKKISLLAKERRSSEHGSIDVASKMVEIKEKENNIIEECEEVVKGIAERMLSQNGRKEHFSLDEFIQAGREGVRMAIKKFSSEKSNGGTFINFVKYKIRFAILDYIRNEGPISRSEVEQIKLFEKAKKDLRLALKREPNSSEIAEKLEITMEELYRIIKIFYKLNPQSLYFNKNSGDGNISSDDKYVNSETYLNPNVARQYSSNLHYEKIIDIKKIGKIIEKEIECLTPRQQDCMRMFFLKEMKQINIAKELKISGSAVKQYIDKALEKLSTKMNRDVKSFLKQYYEDYLKGK